MEIIHNGPKEATGFASTTYYYRINTKKKKEYIIENYYIFGVASFMEKGSHYSLEEKDLTEEQINKLKEYAYGESTYIKPSSESTMSNNIDFYVTIIYDGQRKNYNDSDFQY